MYKNVLYAGLVSWVSLQRIEKGGRSEVHIFYRAWPCLISKTSKAIAKSILDAFFHGPWSFEFRTDVFFCTYSLLLYQLPE